MNELKRNNQETSLSEPSPKSKKPKTYTVVNSYEEKLRPDEVQVTPTFPSNKKTICPPGEMSDSRGHCREVYK